MAASTADPAARREQLRRLARSFLLAAAVFGGILAGLFAYSGTLTPFVIVESNSMQHGNETSSIGTMDTGDIVLVQGVSSPADVITYLRGRAVGHATYGDFGDVVVFWAPGEPLPTLFIHRAFAYVTWNVTACATCYDVPELALLPDAEWDAWDASGNLTAVPSGITRFVLYGGGWGRDLALAVDLRTAILIRISGAGLLTIGDNNAYLTARRIDPWVLPMFNVVGRARGELPWFGLIRSTVSPSEEGCCEAWGSTDSRRGAPANSWMALNVSLVVMISVPVASLSLDVVLARRPKLRERLRGMLRIRGRRRKDADAP